MVFVASPVTPLRVALDLDPGGALRSFSLRVQSPLFGWRWIMTQEEPWSPVQFLVGSAVITFGRRFSASSFQRECSTIAQRGL